MSGHVNGHVPRKPLQAIVEQMAEACWRAGHKPQVGVVDLLEPGRFPRTILTPFGEIIVYRSRFVPIGHIYVGPAQLLEQFAGLLETNQPTNPGRQGDRQSLLSTTLWWEYSLWGFIVIVVLTVGWMAGLFGRLTGYGH